MKASKGPAKLVLNLDAQSANNFFSLKQLTEIWDDEKLVCRALSRYHLLLLCQQEGAKIVLRKANTEDREVEII